MLNVTCFGCCPIVLNSELEPVASVTGSLVYVEGQSKQMQTVGGQANQGLSASTQSDTVALDQVNQMQTVGSQANQGLSASTQSDQVAVATNVFAQDGVGQGQAAGTVLSKFINPFPLALVGEDLIQKGSELQELENRGNTPPPSPPPPRNLPVANDSLSDARFFLPVRLLDDNSGPSNNIGNPKEEQPESPPSPPPTPLRQNATNNQSQILSVTVMEAIAREAEERFPNIESNKVYSQPFQESSLKEPQKTEPQNTEPPVFTGIDVAKFPGELYKSSPSPSPKIKPTHSQASVENAIWV